MGFEPMILFEYAGLANRCLRPLGHLSFKKNKSYSAFSSNYTERKKMIKISMMNRLISKIGKMKAQAEKKKRNTTRPPKSKKK